jgi:hypothetical protein
VLLGGADREEREGVTLYELPDLGKPRRAGHEKRIHASARLFI